MVESDRNRARAADGRDADALRARASASPRLDTPPEHLDRVFDPFFTTRDPGARSGLELSVCHEIVRSHGGRIRASSQRGGGTRVDVQLPSHPPVS